MSRWRSSRSTPACPAKPRRWSEGRAGGYAEERRQDRPRTATTVCWPAPRNRARDKPQLGQLAKEAEKATSGQAFVGLGQAYLSYNMYDEAIDALKKGITKGGATDADEAQISLGIATSAKARRTRPARRSRRSRRSRSGTISPTSGTSAPRRPDAGAAPRLQVEFISEARLMPGFFFWRRQMAGLECRRQSSEIAIQVSDFKGIPIVPAVAAEASQRRQIPDPAGLHGDQGRHQSRRGANAADGRPQATVVTGAHAGRQGFRCRARPVSEHRSRRSAKKRSARTSANAGTPALRR